jgi:hypothetical protein
MDIGDIYMDLIEPRLKRGRANGQKAYYDGFR